MVAVFEYEDGSTAVADEGCVPMGLNRSTEDGIANRPCKVAFLGTTQPMSPCEVYVLQEWINECSAAISRSY